MQNRWFHRPSLHSPLLGKERKVGWLELFYDLIYVATIIQLGNALSHHISVYGFLAFAGLMVPLWHTWTGFTFYSNRYVVDDFAHRALVFVQMFAIGSLAVSVPRVLEGEPTSFALSYMVARLVLVALYARSYFQVEQAREMNRRYAIGFLAGASLWGSSALLPAPWVYLMWTSAMILDLSVPLSRQSRELAGRYPPDVLHMSERYGLLTIIVLGESFVKVLSEVSERGAGTSLLLMCSLGLVITCSLWWIYFDDVAGSRIKRGRLGPYVWIYTHLPLTIAITGCGVAIKKAVFFAPDQAGGEPYRWLLAGTLGLTLLSVGIIDSVTQRRQSELSDRARVQTRIASAFFVLLLAPAGQFMPAWAFLGFIALCCLAQVFFDLTMAPLAADPHAAHHEDPLLLVTAVPSEPVVVTPKTRRPRLGDAVRKGTPNELKRDLYVHLMEGSWLRLFATFIFLFLFTNAVFAALYLLEPGSVSNVHDGSFLETFAFSVQTMSTVGYGVMAPVTTYAHVLMIVEALLSILGVALATGLIFAKVSRPRASVLFSKPLIVHDRFGVPCLSFRVGNARGNEVVEASVRVVVTRDEISPEGHHLRRLHDLKLERDSSPLFMLSWTVLHPIDENSPFHGTSADTVENSFINMVVTLTGHDSTFAQTVHARHMYYPDDVRWNHCFVDVISNLDDGRFLLDFDRFHDSVPVTGTAGTAGTHSGTPAGTHRAGQGETAQDDTGSDGKAH